MPHTSDQGTEKPISADVEQRPTKLCRDCINQIGIQTSSPLAFSDDGATLAYSDGTFGISLFSVSQNGDMSQIAYLLGHTKSVNCILFHPSKPLLVSCGHDGIIVWDLEQQALKQRINNDLTRDAHEGDVTNACWMYDGSVLATCGMDSTIRFWSPESNFSLLETMAAHKSSVLTMCFNKEREYLVSAGRDSSINVWRTQSLNPDNIQKRMDEKGIVCSLVSAMDGHLGDVSVLTTSPDGMYVFSGARDNTIRVWDMKVFKCIREISDSAIPLGKHKADIIGLFSLNNNSLLLSASYDGTMKIFKLGSLAYDPKVDGDMGIVSVDELLKGIVDEVKQEVAHDKLLASCSVYPNTGIYRAALNPAVPLLAMSSKLNALRLYSIEKDICAPVLLKEFASHNSVVNQIAPLSNDNMVSVSDDYIVNVFNPESNMRIKSFNVGTAASCVVSFDDLIFVGGRDYFVHVFSANHDRYYSALEASYSTHGGVPADEEYNLHLFGGLYGKVRSIAVCEPYRLLLAACDDGNLSVYKIPEIGPVDPKRSSEIPTSTPLERVNHHCGLIQIVAVSNNETGTVYVATGGNDYKVNVYELTEKGKLNKLWIGDAHTSVVTSACFGIGKVSKYLFTGGWDFDLLMWDVESGSLSKRLKAHRARICDIDMSPDGKKLITAAADKEVLLWEDLKVVASYTTHDVVHTVLGLNDSFAAGYNSGVIRMWPYYSSSDTAFKDVRV